jgi:hypothetical protein
MNFALLGQNFFSEFMCVLKEEIILKREKLTKFIFLNRNIDYNDVVWKSENLVCFDKGILLIKMKNFI